MLPCDEAGLLALVAKRSRCLLCTCVGSVRGWWPRHDPALTPRHDGRLTGLLHDPEIYPEYAVQRSGWGCIIGLRRLRVTLTSEKRDMLNAGLRNRLSLLGGLTF